MRQDLAKLPPYRFASTSTCMTPSHPIAFTEPQTTHHKNQGHGRVQGSRNLGGRVNLLVIANETAEAYCSCRLMQPQQRKKDHIKEFRFDLELSEVMKQQSRPSPSRAAANRYRCNIASSSSCMSRSWLDSCIACPPSTLSTPCGSPLLFRGEFVATLITQVE